MTPRSHLGLPGVTGTLVSGVFAERRLTDMFAGQLGESTRQRACHAIGSWFRRHGSRLGPASSLRTLAGSGAGPLVQALGFHLCESRDQTRGRMLPAVAHATGATLPVAIFQWGEPMDRSWTDIARLAVHAGTEWVACFNGRSLRLCDARRTYARDFIDFDLEVVAAAPASFALFWGLLRPEALGELTRRITVESARHGVAVCASLRDGVREALALLLQALLNASREDPYRSASSAHRDAVLEQALTIIYRMLFLLFAESRGLVPVWHPVYRASYTIEALRTQAERPGGRRGLWEAFQALSRLAHSGCHAGTLRVTPFNGRLFAPARTPLAERRRLDDDLVGNALVALTTNPGANGRERISFRDLGVEQLGAVYESVLDYEPVIARAPHGSSTGGRGPTTAVGVTLVAQRDRRKASGTFYTPQSMTDYLVRQTLHPLVSSATAEQILSLRVLDPAMGSGAFLVSACRYMASAYEQALVRERGWLPADVTEADRAGFRRLVARRCLYGIDLNPMAVQVARLSLWLATLASDRPLTFLDHHLAVGDSLLGASLDDLARQPPGAGRSLRGSSTLPLFDESDVGSTLERVLPVRNQLESVEDDTAEAVHDKERLLAGLWSASSPLVPLKRAADLWCACWFWDAGEPTAPDGREYADLLAAALHGQSALPKRLVESRLARARRIAEGRRFFHWTLEFPEVFFDGDGRPARNGGFDAIVGNPPWEMLRGDSGPDDQRENRRVFAAQVTRFARAAGVYGSVNHGHANQYQLFIERSLRLVRRGGRVGLVVPWGLASDHGCADLRRLLFEQCNTDRLVGLENAAGIFPIHRGVRFLLLSTTAGTPTRRTRCRFGARDPSELDTIVSGAARRLSRDSAVTITPEFLKRVSGPGMAIPHLRTRQDMRLVEQLVERFPPLADRRGWGATFGRELNATDDRGLFTTSPGDIPIVEGKHVDPFVVHVSECDQWIASPEALMPRTVWRAARRPRLAYRDVASSSNRLTLIAAILPRHTMAVHTVFCLKTRMSLRDQTFLCGMLNSLVANYLARLWVTTHLGTTTVERLPMPRPDALSDEYARMAALAQQLGRPNRDWNAVYARLQAVAARLYGLSPEDLQLVLGSFPLVDDAIRRAVVSAFVELG
ncbi:MAG: N-6 DNA methylase [Acidobacteria bacterium]|nr:N-6 DNA methylase [Acidobacteriota bacterium]